MTKPMILRDGIPYVDHDGRLESATLLECRAEIVRLQGLVDGAYNRGFAVGSGNEGHYQREIERLTLALRHVVGAQTLEEAEIIALKAQNNALSLNPAQGNATTAVGAESTAGGSISTLRLLAKCGSMDLSALGPIADEMERMQNTTVLRDQIDSLMAQVSRLSAENARLQKDLRRANAALVRHGVEEMRPGNAPDEPNPQPTIQAIGWWQCPCCQSFYSPERLVCPVSGDSRPVEPIEPNKAVQASGKDRQLGSSESLLLKRQLDDALATKGHTDACICVRCERLRAELKSGDGHGS